MTLGLSPDEIVARQRLIQKHWRESHPERVMEYREKHREAKTLWQRANRARINQRNREIYSQRKLSAPRAEVEECQHNVARAECEWEHSPSETAPANI